MAKPEAPLSSNQPDLSILTLLGIIHRTALGLLIVFAAVTFCGWVIVPLGRVLPTFWHAMKVNNALMTLLCGMSLALSEPRRTATAVRLSRLIAALDIILAGIFVYERFRHISLAIDTFFAPDPLSPHPGRVSIEACATFFLLGLVLFNLRARKSKLSRLTDAATLCILLLMFMFSARYAFGVSHLFGPSFLNPLSVQTFIALWVLTWLVSARRAEYGIFSLLISSQIGGKTVRLAAPFVILLPFVFSVASSLGVRHHLISDASATAAATSALAILGLCLLFVLGRKTNQFENAVRELSLRDELTKLYNRRGFYFLAEQALRLSQRAGSPFFVLFVDMDNLKIINDTLGHEVGSARLQQLANILEKTFRESDIVGRLGGDEFVVAGRADLIDLGIATQRLDAIAETLNSTDPEAYPITFSLGYVIADPDSHESLETLIERADAIMYNAKRNKKRGIARGIDAAT